MATKIFFSWQADTSTKEGRNFIERALESAIGAINSDIELEEAVRDELQMDRDTLGVPGSPPIVDTIFNKIDEAAIFVPDLTFVGNRLDGRPTPNPNVLVEYGWALKKLGHARIVPVMNTAHGKPEGDAMPFDMRHLKNPIQYNCPDNADGKTSNAAKRNLAKDLETEIRAVLSSAEFRASLPRPPEPKLFKEREPLDGSGRFRGAGKRLGVISRQNSEIYLAAGPAVWLRLMPLHDPGRIWASSELEQAVTRPTLIMPIFARSSSYGSFRDEDGFGAYAGQMDNSKTSEIAYLFENGEIWSIDSWWITATRGHNYISLDENGFARSLENLEVGLQRLGLNRPFKWIAGMEGIEGLGLWLPGRHEPVGRCVSDKIVVDGTLSDHQSMKDSLEPFFARVYDRCGLGTLRPKRDNSKAFID